ncbi:MAG: bifunctional salicylyl-CoA 5-hydroxylase/oxidoreductase [Chloroflexi bacterium]|nr:bifunctional salicylyl-CoA 5-hydroxylase/oxidoreductase [Chloroflexota bacterium]
MKSLVVGGGPGGLYLAILLKKARPAAEVEVIERNAPDATFGFGVVFSDETLGYLQDNDEPTFREITATFNRWDAIEIRYRDEVRLSRGHGFSGIARKRLLEILQRRCRELGGCLRFQVEFDPADVPDLARDYDLIIAADGANSRVRAQFSNTFAPEIDVRRNKYAWFGTTRRFENFLFAFRPTSYGTFWCHAYRYDAQHSTFIVECDPATWCAAGLDRMSEEASAAFCERVFAEDLQGHPLLRNRSVWNNFPMLRTANWRLQDALAHVVLLGDAAHTAHFSIGSGTKLAMEDAIALAYYLECEPRVEHALARYELERKREVDRFQRAAFESLFWFEGVERYMDFDVDQFAFSLLTRSRRISYDTLKVRDLEIVERAHRTFVERSGTGSASPGEILPPPMFTPFQVRDLRLQNRVVVSPMSMYSAEDGLPNDWHLVHLGSRAVGGAGLVIAEMTDVSREGRISPGCAGMYRPEHVDGWRRVVDFVHRWTDAKIALQLGHAGRKGSTRRLWEGDVLPLPEQNWRVVSASSVAYDWINQTPREITRDEMDVVREDHARAARWAEMAGFDMLELHYAHGYLLASFISPLTNLRTDQYGGSVEARMRYPLEVFDAVRAAWPEHKPISVRISAADWASGGLSDMDRIEVARMLKDHGCDLVDVSTGQTVPNQQPRYGRAYQTPFADDIRNSVCIPTMTVGAISTPDEVNSILLAGRADLCVLARPHLRDPYWPLHAAESQEYYALRWPPQYATVQPRARADRRRVPKPLNVRFEEDVRGRYDDLQDRLTRLARLHYRSLNGEILAALEFWLDQADTACHD